MFDPNKQPTYEKAVDKMLEDFFNKASAAEKRVQGIDASKNNKAQELKTSVLDRAGQADNASALVLPPGVNPNLAAILKNQLENSRKSRSSQEVGVYDKDIEADKLSASAKRSASRQNIQPSA